MGGAVSLEKSGFDSVRKGNLEELRRVLEASLDPNAMENDWVKV